MKGKKGNVSGIQLEHSVKSVLATKGFDIVNYNDWKKNEEKYSNELLLVNAPFTSIYGHKGKTEFILRSEKYKIDARIECKWQQVAGSVDEKLPYLYLNCIETMPEKTIIILIDGKGWKPGSIKWLKNAVETKKYITDENKDKTIHVFALVDFFTWANNTFVS